MLFISLENKGLKLSVFQEGRVAKKPGVVVAYRTTGGNIYAFSNYIRRMIHLKSRKSLLAGILWMILTLLSGDCLSQTRREEIYSDFVLYNRRVALEKDLRERIIGRHFSLPLNTDTEDGYLSGCWAVSQFLFDGPEVAKGFNTLFAGYDSLSYDTKRALLEAVYAVAPARYVSPVTDLLEKETDARLFSLCAVYLYRNDPGTDNSNTLKIRMVERFPGYDTVTVLKELENYLTCHAAYIHGKMPDIREIFRYQRAIGQKIIYSFQRWNRDYAGLAIVQNADGSFAKDGQGRLQVFEQLARSGPDLPYFITNGSTPQGIYSIQGTDVSRTPFIGPTPNLQLQLPFEGRWQRYFHEKPEEGRNGEMAGEDSLRLYLELLPAGWRGYAPMMEAWAAGQIGRTEIIAHGTALDPEYYKDKPFYPLTPSMGCLCAKEIWNQTSGHPLVSEQNNLVNAFLSTPGKQGFLFVINVDDQRKPVSRGEIERWLTGK
jgi:hypothetical protein